MKWKTAITIILYLIAAVFIYMSLAEGFNNPNQSKYKTIIRKSKDLEESEIESSRALNPRRKASENKRPWLADSFLDMENLVFEPFDSTYRGSLEWPKYAWPDGTRRDYRPDQVPYVAAGCVISAPPTWDLPTQGNTYLAHINILYGIITKMTVKGPAKVGKQSGLDIPVHVYNNTKDGTVITLTLFTVSVTTEPPAKKYGSCKADTRITNQACECINATPSLVASSATIEAGGNITLWVDSGGYACPDYIFSTTSTGYTLNKSVTQNDLETVTLTSAAGTCGIDYAVVAIVNVVDSCDETSQIRIRNTGGTWADAGYTYLRCQLDCGVGCYNAGCPWGCTGTTYTGETYTSAGTVRKWQTLDTEHACGYTNMGPNGWLWCDSGIPATGDSIPPYCIPPNGCNAGTSPCSDICYCAPDVARRCDWACSGSCPW